MHLVAGPNGVGKSMLLAILAGSLAPDAGEVLLGDISLSTYPAAARQRLSFCPADCPVFPFVIGQEWLALLLYVRGSWNQYIMDILIDAFRLHEHMPMKFAHMSLGTARKFLLPGSIADETDVLILDEPSNGMDAVSLGALQEMLRQQASHRLIVISCHETAQHQAFGIIAENTLMLE